MLKSCFSCRPVSTGSFTSFEKQMIGHNNPFYGILIYGPPGQNSAFMNEFSDFLLSILKLSGFMLPDDFNIHIDNASDKFASSFISITEYFNLTQHVTGPAHIRGHTLDLVFTLGLNIDSVFSEVIFYLKSYKCSV